MFGYQFHDPSDYIVDNPIILSNFPILFITSLEEILYDYIDQDNKPSHSTIFYKKNINDNEIEFIRITCLRCCCIKQNPSFNDNLNSLNNTRPICKYSNVVTVYNNDLIKSAIKKSTYFEYKDNANKTFKGYYDFSQLPNKEKFRLTNFIIIQNAEFIPVSFYKCAQGKCY